MTLAINSSLTPEELVAILVGEEGEFSNVTLAGATQAAGSFSGGITEGLGLQDGVILSTGNIANASGPNNSPNTSTEFGEPGDTDLDVLIDPQTTQDAIVLEFDFIPTKSEITVQFVFASEEYPATTLNDVFGLFVNRENVAFVPGTTDPISVANVNSETNSAFFQNNDFGDEAPFETQFDGFTSVITARAAVTPGVTNNIKIAIADANDDEVDSAVFLAADSFGDPQGPAIQFAAAEFNGEEGTLAEIIVIRTGDTSDTVGATISLSEGTATELEDYDNSPIAVEFAPGQSIQTVQVPLLLDLFVEEPETINLLLTSPTGGANIGLLETTTLTIEDRDPSVGPNTPIAVDDSITLQENTVAIADVLANDTDFDEGDILSLEGLTTPEQGRVEIDSENQVIYTPNPDFVGTDSFDYTVSDSMGSTATATVSVTVTEAPNIPPRARTDSAVSLQNTSVIIDVLANDSDADGDPIQLFEINSPSNGTVRRVDRGTPENLTDDQLIYTPNLGFLGTDSFTYIINDGNGDSDRGTVNVTVIETGTPTPGNNPPNAVNDSRTTAVNTLITINVLANDNDPDGDIIQLISFTNPSNGTVRRNNNNTPQDLSDDRLTYTPNPQFTGADSFTYRIADGNGGIDQATVEVTVGNNGNRNPIVGTPQEDNLIGVEVPETIAGLAGNDFLKGNEGNDLLLGGEGRDSLIGDSGNDILLGGEGDDILLGEEGVDILRGDGGRDRLLGGAEGDLFLLSAETAASSIEGADRIEDFQVGSDRLGLIGQITQQNLDLSLIEGNTVIAIAGMNQVLAIVERIAPDQLNDSFLLLGNN